jgi:hypothetical protein
VNTEYDDEADIQKINLLLYEQWQKTRSVFAQSDLSEQKQVIKNILTYTSPGKLSSESKGSISQNGYNVERFILRQQGQVPLPLLLLMPDSEPGSIVVWFSEHGKNKLADSAALIKEHLEQNRAIVFADLRGIGETEDRSDMNDPKYFNKEYRNAMLAIHIGNSLLSQRTKDVETVMIFLKQKFGNLPLLVHASGPAALPALHAAVLNESMEELHLYNMLPSWRQVLDDPLQKHVYGEVIPGVLKHYDIPDLARMKGRYKLFIH